MRERRHQVGPGGGQRAGGGRERAIDPLLYARLCVRYTAWMICLNSHNQLQIQRPRFRDDITYSSHTYSICWTQYSGCDMLTHSLYF